MYGLKVNLLFNKNGILSYLLFLKKLLLPFVNNPQSYFKSKWYVYNVAINATTIQTPKATLFFV